MGSLTACGVLGFSGLRAWASCRSAPGLGLKLAGKYLPFRGPFLSSLLHVYKPRGKVSLTGKSYRGEGGA